MKRFLVIVLALGFVSISYANGLDSENISETTCVIKFNAKIKYKSSLDVRSGREDTFEVSYRTNGDLKRIDVVGGFNESEAAIRGIAQFLSQSYNEEFSTTSKVGCNTVNYN